MKTGTYSEPEILKGMQYQDDKILLYMYHNNFRSVKHYIENNSGTNQDAEDIFQEAMILIYTKVREGNLELKCSVHTYLYSIARILWLKQLDLIKKRNFALEESDSFISENQDIL